MARKVERHLRLLRIMMVCPSVQLEMHLASSGIWVRVIMESSGDPLSVPSLEERAGLNCVLNNQGSPVNNIL